MGKRRTRILVLIALLAGVLPGLAQARAAFRLTSADFGNGSRIPVRHEANAFGCAGKNMPPTLFWSGQPPGTRSFALTMVDVDVHPSPFVHWAVYDIPGFRRQISSRSLGGVRQVVNSAGSRGYLGPCPPPGAAAHHYVFSLYAVNVAHLARYNRLADLLRGLRERVLAKTTLVGTFQR